MKYQQLGSTGVFVSRLCLGAMTFGGGSGKPVGAVNERSKLFSICANCAGLSGSQGVIVPASNIRNLMLREDVRSAVAAGQFHIHAVETVDQAMELLTHIEAGERLATGEYPPDTINHYVFSAQIRTRSSFRIPRSSKYPATAPIVP